MPKINIFDDLTISVETLDHVYKQLYFLIKQNHDLAKEKGKKLLVIVGEDHLLSHAFLFQIIILIIAKELGINNLYWEMTRNTKTISQLYCVLGMDNIEYLLRKIPIVGFAMNHLDRKETLKNDKVTGQKINEKYFRTYRNAVKIGFNVWSVDDYHDSPNFDLRNAAMAENLKLLNREGILLTGFDHVPGLIEDFKLDNEYHILTINGCFVNKDVIRALRIQEGMGMYDQDITSAIQSKDFATYTAINAKKRVAKYLHYDNAIQIIYDNKGYSIFDKSGKVLNIKSSGCEKSAIYYLKRPSLPNLVLDIPYNVRHGFGLISDLCKKAMALPPETLSNLQDFDRKTRAEFEQLNASVDRERLAISFTSVSPTKIKLNLRTLHSLSERIKNKKSKDQQLVPKTDDLTSSGRATEMAAGEPLTVAFDMSVNSASTLSSSTVQTDITLENSDSKGASNERIGTAQIQAKNN